MKEEEKKKPNPKPFILEVDCLVPATIAYRVIAEDEDEAFKIFESQPHMAQPQGPPKIKFVPTNQLIKKKISIRSFNSVFTNWVRNF